MDFLKSRLFVVAAGAVAMILIGIGLAFTILHRNPPSTEPPPASQTGLIIDVKQGAEIKRDPNQEYRCFKSGQYVSMATLEQCAKMNGVLSGALDVGIDETGALAAADTFGTAVAPLPPPGVNAPSPASPAAIAPAAPAPPPPAPTSQVVRGPSSTCQRYDHGWTSIGEMSLNTCLQLLYAGHCERPGGALYGRWGDQSLRLVPGRVEQSRDDRTFRTLVEQGAGCTIPNL